MQFVRDIRPFFLEKLAPVYGEKEANSMVYWSVESVLGFSKSDCIIQQDAFVSETQKLKLLENLENPFLAAIKLLRKGTTLRVSTVSLNEEVKNLNIQFNSWKNKKPSLLMAF